MADQQTSEKPSTLRRKTGFSYECRKREGTDFTDRNPGRVFKASVGKAAASRERVKRAAGDEERNEIIYILFTKYTKILLPFFDFYDT